MSVIDTHKGHLDLPLNSPLELEPLVVKIHFIRPNVQMPLRATPGSAAMDLSAAIESEVIIHPMKRLLVPCGFAMEIPHGFEAQIRPRSGLAVRDGITIINAPGTIDSDYRGEIMVCLINLGEQYFILMPRARIAQMLFSLSYPVNYVTVNSLSDTERSDGGFGSTGA